MSTSTALASPTSLPLGSSSKHDPALKPNPHPYAIKTTHTALLSRSNSSGHNTPSKYFYMPSPGPSSRSPTKNAHEYRGHRYSTSLTGELPSRISSPLPFPRHGQGIESEGDPSISRPRADTLPTYLADDDNTPSTEPIEDLPLNPKTWTPSQLSVYLTRALRVRSGERPPERVARDIALWVRREGVSGRTFLRWTHENLENHGVNMLWRSALLAAARNLRQDVLRGRIWGNPTSGPEQEQEQEQGEADAPFGNALYASSSSSLDFPLTGGDAEGVSEGRSTRRSRMNTNANGRVRGMVDKWERESAGSRSHSRNSNCSWSGSESENGSELGEDEVAIALAEENVGANGARNAPVSPFPGNDKRPEPCADDEPCIEDLLAAESASPVPEDGSWGARAWEDLDAGVTVRRIETHDTVVPRRDASEGSSGSVVGGALKFDTLSKRGGGTNTSSRRVRGSTKKDAQLVRPTAADIFALAEAPADTTSKPVPALAEAGVQADMVRGAELAELEGEEEEEEEEGAAAVAVLEVELLKAKELALENEVRGTRALLEEFRRRLEEVEARVSRMEAESAAAAAAAEEEEEEERQQLAQASSKTLLVAGKETHDKAVEALPTKEEAVATLDLERGAEAAAAAADEKEVVESGPAEVVGAVRHVVDLGPKTVSDLPSYVLLVGLGVCAVVLQVVLKRIGGRTLKS